MNAPDHDRRKIYGINGDAKTYFKMHDRHWWIEQLKHENEYSLYGLWHKPSI